MFIGSDSNLMKITQRNYCIRIYRQLVDRVSSSKALGVVTHEHILNHIDYICKTVSSAVGGLPQMKDFISKNTAVTVYSGLIQPWFNYCNLLLTTSAERLQSLQKLQNRAACIITR